MGVKCDLFSCMHIGGRDVDKAIHTYLTPENPAVQVLAKTLHCDPRRIFRYCQRITYVTPVDDAWQYPEETIKKGAGDCMDTSLLCVSMLIHCGHDAWVSLVLLPDKKGTDGIEFHAYAEMKSGGKVVKLETTCRPEKCGFGQMPKVRMVKLLDFDHNGVIKKYRG